MTSFASLFNNFKKKKKTKKPFILLLILSQVHLSGELQSVES